MKYLLLAAFCLASVSPSAWARDLTATEKQMAGSWIETSHFQDRMEFFEDGTGKGVLGDYFSWMILADNRLKAEAPVFGGLKIATSEPVDLREGYFLAPTLQRGSKSRRSSVACHHQPVTTSINPACPT